MFSYIVLVAALASPALAAVSITAPVEATQWTAGSPQSITWMDNGQQPDLKSFGPSSVGIFVGNAIQQTELQHLADNVDVSTASSIVFTPDPSIGPNGAFYFVRFTSNSLKDTTNAINPAQAFSAKFGLSGMSGSFNATIQAEVDAGSSSPVGGPTSAPGGAASSSGAPAAQTTSSAASTPAAASSNKPASSSAHSSASPSGSAAANAANGASGLTASIGFVGTAVLVFASVMFFK